MYFLFNALAFHEVITCKILKLYNLIILRTERTFELKKKLSLVAKVLSFSFRFEKQNDRNISGITFTLLCLIVRGRRSNNKHQGGGGEGRSFSYISYNN